ncbi:MAG: SRPBCC family protein, partial [Methylovirgula sp.]
LVFLAAPRFPVEFPFSLDAIDPARAARRRTGRGVAFPYAKAKLRFPEGMEKRPMKKLLVLAAGSAALIFSCASASAIESNYKASSTSSADTVWSKVGGFCGIANWHPAVAKCELSHGNKIRTLSLKGGGTIVERLLRWNNKGKNYTYMILSSPLPVTSYVSTIKVVAKGTGSEVGWTGKYKAKKGTSDADAKKVIDGIYKAGVDVLAQ